MDWLRVAKLLGMKPLTPEGGFFAEALRSDISIDTEQIRPGYRGKRALFTAIYYLLTADECSAPHTLRSDEIWFFHIGDPIELTLISPDGKVERRIIGNNLAVGQRPQLHIPAGWTQSAKLIPGENGFALVSMMVVPGFELEDFELAE